jgi:hypothetical protein
MTEATSHETPCTCVAVDTPCYLWIHLPHGPGRIITFPNPALAYTFADNYINGEMATLVAESEGQYMPDVQRDITLCRLSAEIATGIKPARDGHWFIMSSDRHQMLVGLGQNVPNDLLRLMPSGYTLEAHDQPDDMPHLVYEPKVASDSAPEPAPAPESAPAPEPAPVSEPLSLLTRLSNWVISNTGAKSPRVNDDAGFGGAV